MLIILMTIVCVILCVIGLKDAYEKNPYRIVFFWNDGRFGENPLDALIRQERNREMLAAMTDKQREVFLLYYKEGYTQQQIADMLDVDQTSVRDRLDGGLKKTKKFF